jgi:hypothetical protein
MAIIQIFDPALCCSTGVCGVEVDQEMVRFAADVEWLRTNGAPIKRFNLAQQPMAFAEHPVVKSVLERQGPAGLPLTLVDGEPQCSGRYPSRDELATWAGVATTAASSRTASVLPAIKVVPAAPGGCCPMPAATDSSTAPGTGCCG